MGDELLGRVLVVDDEPELRRIFRRNLVRAGHTVLEAASGRAALALVRQLAFDVVISDVRMPDLDGLDLLEVLQREKPQLPVVLVSGSPDLERASAAYGALDYLVKPVKFEDLRSIVKLAIELGRRGLSGPPPARVPASNARASGDWPTPYAGRPGAKRIRIGKA
jgi:DNA-binding NtrC family response regulator